MKNYQKIFITIVLLVIGVGLFSSLNQASAQNANAARGVATCVDADVDCGVLPAQRNVNFNGVVTFQGSVVAQSTSGNSAQARTTRIGFDGSTVPASNTAWSARAIGGGQARANTGWMAFHPQPGVNDIRTYGEGRP